MEKILQRIEECDVGTKQILLEQGIDDMQTFVELDNNDFSRLMLRTKVIKLIQRIQKELYDDMVIEERLEEDDHENGESSKESAKNDEDALEGSNDFQGITLEKVIDINLIFKRSANAKAIIEMLKEGQKADDKCMNAIKNILCEFLQSVYGLRPSAFHKNLLAQSLVRSYPALKSSNPDVPQALWFHPNARGKNHHSGRLHYHMEYLARKSGVRIVNRSKTQADAANGAEEAGADSANPGEEADMQAVVQELKFLCPGPNTKLRAEELWHLAFNERKEMRQKGTFHLYLETYPAATAFNGSLVQELKFLCPGPNTKLRAEELWHLAFNERKEMRQKGTFHLYLETYPAATAFNGSLISLEFRLMHPAAPDYDEKLAHFQPKLLLRYQELFKHVKNDFIRTLMINRQKCPSRGAKRARDGDPAKENILKGIVEWINPEDQYPDSSDVPILYVKGDFLEAGSSAAIIWKGNNVLLEPDLKDCFRILCESQVVFNAACTPTDKQFYVFVLNVF